MAGSGPLLERRRRPRALKDPVAEVRLFAARAAQGFALIVLALLVLLGRYLWLQVVHHDEYRTRSEQNRIKSRPLPPSRGLIYDRNGVLLAENVLEYRLEIVPERVADVEAVVAAIAQLIPLDADERESFEQLRQTGRRFNSLPLKFHLSESEVARFSVNRHRFPGVEVVPYLKRFYPFGAGLGHVIGYVGRLGSEDRERLDDPRYSATTHVGKTGIERYYEDRLLGDVGYEQVETNAEGRALRVLERIAPRPGQHLHLSLDARLQRLAIEAMAGQPGAVVAIDPRNGEVLCMLSLPGFDPNLFVDGISRKNYAALTQSPHRPLFDRALSGGYTPGSTIKPFMALAGLELGLRTPSDTIWSSGEFHLPNQSQFYRDWKKGGHGRVDLRESLAQSVNTYYYQLANDLGIDRMSAYLGRFGFGAATGIDLHGEALGVLPSRAWKSARIGKPWYPGETVIAGIGQGYWVLTPLQLATALATLASDGVAHRPHLLRATQAGIDAPIIAGPGGVDRPALIDDPAHLAAVKDGMIAVMHGATGSARAIGQGAPYRIAGKSGTAQRVTHARRVAGGDRQAAEELRNQALFVAFAPAEQPSIAVAVVVEFGDSGTRAAAPVARQILDAWLLPATAPPILNQASLVDEASQAEIAPDHAAAADAGEQAPAPLPGPGP
ncbi:MAG: penicillin-binding protein 2 [Lysobacterales bacterium]